MKRTGKRIAALILCVLFLLLLPGAALAAAETTPEEPYELQMMVSAEVSGIPAGAVMLDLLVPMNDASALAAAMERLAADPALAKKLSENAAALREELSLDAIAEKWLELLEAK